MNSVKKNGLTSFLKIKVYYFPILLIFQFEFAYV